MQHAEDLVGERVERPPAPAPSRGRSASGSRPRRRVEPGEAPRRGDRRQRRTADAAARLVDDELVDVDPYAPAVRKRRRAEAAGGHLERDLVACRGDAGRRDDVLGHTVERETGLSRSAGRSGSGEAASVGMRPSSCAAPARYARSADGLGAAPRDAQAVEADRGSSPRCAPATRRRSWRSSTSSALDAAARDAVHAEPRGRRGGRPGDVARRANGLDRFEGRSSLKTWIMRILVNRAKTRGTRERRTVPFAALAAAETDGDFRPSTRALQPRRPRAGPATGRRRCRAGRRSRERGRVARDARGRARGDRRAARDAAHRDPAARRRRLGRAAGQ